MESTGELRESDPQIDRHESCYVFDIDRDEFIPPQMHRPAEVEKSITKFRFDDYFEITPNSVMCKFCSKEYAKESGLKLISHLAKTECHDVDNCLLIHEDAQKRLQRALNLSRREQDSIPTDQVPTGKANHNRKANGEIE